jgi:hypothetical protein
MTLLVYGLPMDPESKKRKSWIRTEIGVGSGHGRSRVYNKENDQSRQSRRPLSLIESTIDAKSNRKVRPTLSLIERKTDAKSDRNE